MCKWQLISCNLQIIFIVQFFLAKEKWFIYIIPEWFIYIIPEWFIYIIPEWFIYIIPEWFIYIIIWFSI